MVKKPFWLASSTASLAPRSSTRTARIGSWGRRSSPKRLMSALLKVRSQAKPLPATDQLRLPSRSPSTTSGSSAAILATSSRVTTSSTVVAASSWYRRGRLCGVVVAETLLRIDGLNKRYLGVTALDDLSFTLPRGLVGLVGANGAGKTTMFRLLLGLSRPTEGAIEVCGINVAADPIEVRSRLGYMPEHDCLPLDQTAADVVSTFGELSGLPARAARQRASDILDLVGLDEARFRPIGGFSTGMRQGTKLAHALGRAPRLRVLAEP